jgi:hypothetical protein
MSASQELPAGQSELPRHSTHSPDTGSQSCASEIVQSVFSVHSTQKPRLRLQNGFSSDRQRVSALHRAAHRWDDKSQISGA